MFALARYNTDGSPDTRFGHGGTVTTNLAVDGDDEAYAVALQSHQRIVVAGVSDAHTGFVIARYDGQGSLDATFGSGGVVGTAFTGGARPNSLAVQPDGRLVAVGVAGWSGSNSSFAIARYRPNGSLDATFGTAGTVTTNLTAGTDWINGVALQRNGEIVVAGVAGTRNPRFALARYTTSGVLDTTFGNRGTVTTDVTPYTDSAAGVAIDPAGRIVAAGESGTFGGTDPQFAVIRYEAG